MILPEVKIKAVTVKSFLIRLSILALVSWLLVFVTTPTKAQQNDTLFLPIDNITFSPDKAQFTNFGQVDLTVTVSDFSAIANQASCRFTFSQQNAEGANSTVVKNSSYTNQQCVGVLTVAEQISDRIDINIIITNPDNQKIGTDLVFLASSESVEEDVVDPNEFEFPTRSLYIKPEISVVLDKSKLQVGNVITVQYQIRNRDNFILKNFELNSRIPDETAKIGCNSFAFTSTPLAGDVVNLPGLSPIQTVAQGTDTARCSDEFSFRVNLVGLESGKTTRLNFDIALEKEGELKFDIATNLDQGGISRQTGVVTVIKPADSSGSVPQIVYYIGFAVGATIIIAGGIFGYFFYRKWKEENTPL